MKTIANIIPPPILAVLIIGMALTGSIASADETFQPVFKPALTVDRTAGSIKIDGKLDDPGWEKVVKAANFAERSPGDNTKPEVETEAFMTYDDGKLYVAFVCHDQPAAIRATMCQRDQFTGDDAACFLVDTYGDAAWAYEFFVNPYGVQKDMLWSSVGGEDPGIDLIWESAALITDSGYQVEMAIPFASIRFPNQDVQTWRVEFWRNRPRESFKQYTWSANDRNEQCWPCQWGTVEGIKNVHPGKGIEILPSVVTYQSGSLSPTDDKGLRFKNDDPEGELSLGGKYAIKSDLTVEATYNPDFSQIESDAAQIDVNTTYALMYPERRPFFQEGSDIFRTMFNSFYTRTINDPQLAIKLTGRMGKNSVGFLSALDQNTPYMIPLPEMSALINTGKSFANILRGSRAFGNNSMIGFMINDRRLDGSGSGTIATFDYDFRLSKSYSTDGQFIASHTTEPVDTSLTSGLEGILFDKGKHTAAFDGESFYGSAFITRLKRDARSWNFLIDYDQVSPSYRTEIGFDPVMDYRNLTVYQSYNIYPKNSLLVRITPQASIYRRWNFDGMKKIEENDIGVDGQLKIAQIYFSVNFGQTNELWGGVQFDHLWGVNTDLSGWINNRLGYDLEYRQGVGIDRYRLVKENETTINTSLFIKPVDRLTIEPDISYFKSTQVGIGEKLYRGYITRTRVKLQANRQLSFRLVVQYDDFEQNWEVDPLLTYRVNSFSVLYVGSAYNYNNLILDPGDPSRWKMTSRQFFMKLQYLFQT
jgi:hypothetical protein